MKILLIHNKYKHSGGEDLIFESEKNLFERHGHTVKTLIFDNNEIDSVEKKLKLGYQLIYNRKSGRIVDKAIGNFKPDVIHVHNIFYVASPSVLFVAYRNKIPVIVTLHNYRLICSGSLLMRDSRPCELCVNKKFPIHGVKYGCHRSSKIGTAQLTLATGIHKSLKTWNNKVSMYIALTRFAKRKFINSSLNLRPEQIVVKPNSVDDINPSGTEERKDYYLFVGRLSQEKGIEVLLKAFEKRDINLEIMGDGPFKEAVEKAAVDNTNIKYLGYGDRSLVVSKLRTCRALIVPSICYESLPTSVLEAFSSGTPVIISDIENLNEIITHNYNGIHFKTGDPVDLYKKAMDFKDNNTQYRHLYINARTTYLEKYTSQTNYENLISIYKSAIKNANS